MAGEQEPDRSAAGPRQGGSDPHEAGERGGEESIALKDAVRFAMEEARMVLPGIQALFGFQLIAVFNQRFEDLLDRPQRIAYLAALLLIALACALVMVPAAYHRRSERGRVSDKLLRLASFFIGGALLPLLLAISLDVYLVTFIVTGSHPAAIAVGVVCAASFAALWLVYPRLAKRAP